MTRYGDQSLHQLELNMKFFITLLLLLLIPFSVQSQTLPPPTGPVTETFETATPLPTNLHYGWYFQVWNPPSSIGIVTDPVEGDKVLGCVVHPTGSTNGGERCEILYQPYDPIGSTRTYEYKFMILPDFPDPQNGEWVHFGQWDDQPADGDWTQHPPGSPLTSVDYARYLVTSLPPSLVAYWNLFFPAWQTVIDNMGTPENTADDQISIFGVSVGQTVPKQTIAAVPFAKGQWQDLKFEFKWSYDTNDGFVNFYYKGVGVGQFVGNNMGNTFPHFFKTGIYRDSALNSTQAVLIDDIKIY